MRAINGSKRSILRGLRGRVRSFLKVGVKVHVSRSCIYESGGVMEAGYGWNWTRVWSCKVYECKSVSQGIEVTGREFGRIAGDVLEMVIDFHPEWLRKDKSVLHG